MTADRPTFASLYAELRAIASRHLRRERSCHTLQPTALVHEAYLRFSAQPGGPPADRTQFLANASRLMREILLDYARAHNRLKRGAGAHRVTLQEWHLVDAGEIDIEALEEALIRLEALDARQARIVEMRFFAGMTIAEVAETVGTSAKTVERDWKMARAFLSRAISGTKGTN